MLRRSGHLESGYLAARRLRRGAASKAALGILAAGTAAATMVVLREPLGLSANPGSGAVTKSITADDPERQRVAEMIAGIVARSHGVLAVNDTGPFLEVVLWIEDGEPRDVTDLSEVLVLSYSSTVRAIVAWQLDSEVPIDGDPPTGYGTSFCTWWRGLDATTRRPLATGVRAFSVQGNASERNAGGMSISLTWADDSADGIDSATIPIDAR